jgi:hypothetical protein
VNGRRSCTHTMFDDVYLVDDTLDRIDANVVTAFERESGLSLPEGYQEFVATLGVGTYCDLINVFPPARIVERTEEARRRWKEHYYWDRGGEILPMEQVLRSSVIGNSVEGDEMIIPPESPNREFILPRHDDTIYWMPYSLADPIAWQSSKSRVLDLPPFRYFEPWSNRSHVELFTCRKDIDFDSLVSSVLQRFTSHETRLIGDRICTLLFAKAIGGRIQFTGGADGRIGIRIDHNTARSAPVGECIQFLEQSDFYTIGRSNC